MSSISSCVVTEEAPSKSEKSDVRDSQASDLYWRCKAALDRVIAALLLIPFLPVMGILALLVRLTSKGPAIFRQVRVGKDGREYTMLKFRSMRCDAEAKSGPMWSQKGDPRVTGLGRVLRKLHLDEIPQLINVLRGEMALVGPRPERPEFVEVFAEEIPEYCERHIVRPGITGYAQINLPPDNDLESVKRKLHFDLAYIEQAGWWLDLRILLATSLRIIGVPGNFAARVTGVQKKNTVPNLNDTVVNAQEQAMIDTTTLTAIKAQIKGEPIAVPKDDGADHLVEENHFVGNGSHHGDHKGSSSPQLVASRRLPK